MAKPKPVKTLEQLIDGYYRMQINMLQNMQGLANGSITKETLRERAVEMAEEQFRKNAERYGKIVVPGDGVSLTSDQINDYRTERQDAYEDVYEVNEANDYVTLQNLIELEVQIFIAKYDLQKPNLKPFDKQKHWESLYKLVDAHSKLQKDLGIDKKTRDTKKENKSPLEKFEIEIRRADAWMRGLVDKFPSEADNVTQERDLRELMKSTFGFDFVLIDSIIGNVKRVNGLDPKVEVYD